MSPYSDHPLEWAPARVTTATPAPHIGIRELRAIATCEVSTVYLYQAQDRRVPHRRGLAAGILDRRQGDGSDIANVQRDLIGAMDGNRRSFCRKPFLDQAAQDCTGSAPFALENGFQLLALFPICAIVDIKPDHALSASEIGGKVDEPDHCPPA